MGDHGAFFVYELRVRYAQEQESTGSLRPVGRLTCPEQTTVSGSNLFVLRSIPMLTDFNEYQQSGTWEAKPKGVRVSDRKTPRHAIFEFVTNAFNLKALHKRPTES